jgi:uncharacterized protein DUF4382
MTDFERATLEPDTYRAARARRAPLLALAAALLAASGCTLKTDVAATGGTAGNVTHLWVTVNEVWLAIDAGTPPEAGAGWNKHVLTAPVSFDLATLGSGTLEQLASQVSTAAGTYHQVHLVLADSGDALTTSAQAAGLGSNAQITVTDASGAITNAPLESAVPGLGLTVATNLTLAGSLNLGSSASSSTAGTSSTTGSTTGTPTPKTATLALTIDGARDVLPYSYGTVTAYILSAITSAADEARAGGISGTIDASALASGAGPISVSAEIPDPTNSHHLIVQRRAVGSGGAFTLYPLPTPSSGTASYDLVIAGAGVQTMIVRAIPVATGSALSPVIVQSTPFVLAPAPIVYADIALQSTALPGGARVAFYQTIPASGELPYAIDGSAVDLASRRLPGDFFALGAGPLMVGDYATGSPVSFATLAPVEGDSGFVIGSEGQYRADTLLKTPTLVSGSSTAPTPIVPPYPAIAAGGSAGALSVTLQATAGVYDSGFIVVAAGNRVVDAASVGTLLAGGGGTITIANVPSGGGLAAGAGVPYQVAVRAWNSTNAAASLVRVAAATSTVLGAGSRGSVTLRLP